MSDENGLSKWLSPTTVLGIGIIGIAGFAIWKVSDYFKGKQQIIMQLEEQINEELIDLDEFTDLLKAQGQIREDQYLSLESKEGHLTTKLLALENLSSSWWEDVGEMVSDIFKSALFYGIPAVALLYSMRLLYNILKDKNIGGGPSGQAKCSKDGLEFSDEANLNYHVQHVHTPNLNPVDVESARTIFLQQPVVVQEMIAYHSEIHGKAWAPDWSIALTPQEQMQLATAMMMMATIALCGPLGAAASLLVY